MYHENMKVDANILKVTLREMGMMTFCRLNKRYHLVAFQLASYTLHRLIDKMPKGYEKELTQIEIMYIYSFQNARYDIWKALICICCCNSSFVGSCIWDHVDYNASL